MADKKTKPKSFQEWMEVNIWGLLIVTALVLSVGGLVEIVPLFYMKNTMEHNTYPEIVWDKAGKEPIVTVDEAGQQQWNWKTGEGMRPYTALELAGRDIYQREGCYLCHSQMIRPFRDERERYGHYSLASESMFDHPSSGVQSAPGRISRGWAASTRTNGSVSTCVRRAPWSLSP